MRAAVARLKNPVLEVLLFRVGGVRYGVELGQVVGLVRDLPPLGAGTMVEDAHLMLFEGRPVPVFPASDFLQTTGTDDRRPSEAIIFDDGRGLYGMAVEGTDRVMEVTVGDDLYVFPPRKRPTSPPAGPGRC